jgi:hypothetical protein
MSSDFAIAGSLCALAFISLTYFHSRRGRGLHSRKSRFGFRRGQAGNVLHQLRAYVHPHVKHKIVQMQKQELIENNTHHHDPVAHIRNQAVRIQRGEQVDRITALVADEKSRT